MRHNPHTQVDLKEFLFSSIKIDYAFRESLQAFSLFLSQLPTIGTPWGTLLLIIYQWDPSITFKEDAKILLKQEITKRLSFKEVYLLFSSTDKAFVAYEDYKSYLKNGFDQTNDPEFFATISDRFLWSSLDFADNSPRITNYINFQMDILFKAGVEYRKSFLLQKPLEDEFYDDDEDGFPIDEPDNLEDLAPQDISAKYILVKMFLDRYPNLIIEPAINFFIRESFKTVSKTLQQKHRLHTLNWSGGLNLHDSLKQKSINHLFPLENKLYDEDFLKSYGFQNKFFKRTTYALYQKQGEFLDIRPLEVFQSWNLSIQEEQLLEPILSSYFDLPTEGARLDLIQNLKNFVDLRNLLEEFKLWNQTKETIFSYYSFFKDTAYALKCVKNRQYEEETYPPSKFQDGFSNIKILHDYLSTIIMERGDFKLNQKLDFLPPAFEDFQVYIPTTSKHLRVAGQHLGICVGNGHYARRTVDGQSKIFFLKKNNNFSYCIELNKSGDIVQMRGQSNRSPTLDLQYKLQKVIDQRPEEQKAMAVSLKKTITPRPREPLSEPNARDYALIGAVVAFGSGFIYLLINLFQ